MSEPPRSGKCFECGADCSSDYYCYGCGEFVCAGCSLNDSLTSCHDQSEHLEEPREEEDDE